MTTFMFATQLIIFNAVVLVWLGFLHRVQLDGCCCVGGAADDSC